MCGRVSVGSTSPRSLSSAPGGPSLLATLLGLLVDGVVVAGVVLVSLRGSSLEGFLSVDSPPGGRLVFGGFLPTDAACCTHTSSSLIQSPTSLRVFADSGLAVS